jgi:hypothetical protein
VRVYLHQGDLERRTYKSESRGPFMEEIYLRILLSTDRQEIKIDFKMLDKIITPETLIET